MDTKSQPVMGPPLPLSCLLFFPTLMRLLWMHERFWVIPVLARDMRRDARQNLAWLALLSAAYCEELWRAETQARPLIVQPLAVGNNQERRP